MIHYTSNDIFRFWSKVNRINDPDQCWEWIGAKRAIGYGTFQIKSRYYGAHRIMWELSYGDIPRGMEVCHKCDNPACVNPMHLWLGTHKQNMLDRASKGRTARGERTNTGKLTAQDVISIREQYATRSISLIQLGNKYGVSGTAIHSIVTRKSWKHV